MDANISNDSISQLSEIFHIIGQLNRVKILLVIGQEEACVCHIEAVLHIRQATISQHLKIMRDAGLLTAERSGRNIFYRLAITKLYDAILQMAFTAGISSDELGWFATRPIPSCPCPACNPGQDPALSCQKINADSMSRNLAEG